MKILKDSFIYVFGELFAKILPFLLLPYLTRKLGTAGFGELSYYQTVVSLLAIFFGLSQDGALTRYYHFYGKRNLHNIMTAGYVYTAILAILALIYAWINNSLIIATIVLAATTQTILGTQLAWRQCQKRALAYTAIQTASGVSGSILTVLLLEYTENTPIVWRFVALILANFSVSFIAYLLIKKEKKNTITFSLLWLSLRYVLAFGVPLLLHHASGFVKGQLDRIVIYQNFSATELGIYAAALQLAGILSVLLMAINKATVPHYYAAIKSGQLNANQIKKMALICTLFSPIFAFVAWLLPENVFTWFLGKHYVGVQYYICLFLFGFGLTMPYFLLVNFLFFHGENKLIASISVVSAAIYLVVLLMIYRFGLAFVPYAMIVGNLAILPILAYFVREKHVQAA